jgi:hypothetical protein
MKEYGRIYNAWWNITEVEGVIGERDQEMMKVDPCSILYICFIMGMTLGYKFQEFVNPYSSIQCPTQERP